MIKKYLTDLYRGCKDGCITITTLPDCKNEHIPVEDIDRAAQLIEALGQKYNTYYNMALRRPGLGEYNRGKEEDIHTVVCMFADIDIAGPAHKQDALPKTQEEVLSFLDTLELQPSYIINSGNGIHAIWLLEEPFLITSPEDLRYIRAISHGFGRYFLREGQKHGWILDSVQDVTRMLRAPETQNYKTDPPRPCTVVSSSTVRYPLSAFESYKAEPKDYAPMEVEESVIGSAERMLGRCAFIDTCVKDAGCLPEPWWHAMLSIVALTEDGHEKCHEWSAPYYDYDPDQTDERVKRAFKEKKPCSCEFISGEIGFNCPEGGCQNNGKTVRGPIAFSFYTKDEQLERLLQSDLDVDAALGEKNLRLAAYAKENAPANYIRLKKKYQALGIGVRDLENSIRSVADEKATAKEDFFGGINLEGIDTTGLVMPDRWMLSMGGLEHMVTTPSGTFIDKVTATPVLITRKIEDLTDGNEKLEITFYRNNRWKHLILPRGDAMDKGRLVKYATGGLPVHTGNNQQLVQYFALFEEANDIPFNRSIDHLGWVGGVREFYPYHMKDEVVFEGESAEAAKLSAAIGKEGNEATWMEMAVRLRTMPFARAVLAASFASVLLYPLQQRNIYLHVWTDSRSGKTAAQKAAVSIWGAPEKLLINYNSTHVGFERSAAAMNNLPLALDELQSCSLKPDQFSRLVYMLSNGDGRTRGDRLGGTQPLLHWRNAILSTGEQPVIVGNSMDGVVTRVMDINGVPIPDEAFAAEVHRISALNYGFAGERFILWLYKEYLSVKGGLDRLKDEFSELMENISFLYDLFEGRDAGFQLGNVSVIAFADYLSSMALFGVEKEQAEQEAITIATTLLKNLHNQEKADSIDRAWDYICDWAKSNKMHFEVKRRLVEGFERAAVSPVFGRYYPSEKKVSFIPSCFYQALRDGDFSVEKCYHGFKERGYIDKVQKKTRVGNDDMKTISAEIDLDLHEMNDVEEDFKAAFEG